MDCSIAAARPGSSASRCPIGKPNLNGCWPTARPCPERSMPGGLRSLLARVAVLVAVVASPGAAHGQDSAAPAQRAAEAHVEPGDRVAVKVYLEPGLSDEVLVNSRGDIT